MDPDGKWTSTRAVLLAAAGQNRWPPAGTYMAATGQDLMAADTGTPATTSSHKTHPSPNTDGAPQPLTATARLPRSPQTPTSADGIRAVGTDAPKHN